MQTERVVISNWNNLPEIDANVLKPSGKKEVENLLQNSAPFIARGAGRSYGDASLYETVCCLSKEDDPIVFDGQAGTVTCSCAVTLDDVIREVLPHGYILPVLPGTKYITIGGAIAADIHGKNHLMEGSFGNSVLAFELMTSKGAISCTRDKNSDFFWNTIGGQGLTGIILKATLKLKKVNSANFNVRQTKYEQIKHLLPAFYKSNSEFKIAWVGNKTSTGYHIVFSEADYASDNTFELPDKRAVKIPFPLKLVNKFSIKMYNAKRYANTKNGEQVVSLQEFMFPLDTMHNWNAAYGKKGFMQYQCCIPKGEEKAIEIIIEQAYNSGLHPFLIVIKELGEGNTNSPLSFPKKGFTISLDFAYHKKLNGLFLQMDEVVLRTKGRIYLAKDCRLSADSFYKMYPEANKYKQFLTRNCEGKFNSILANRLKLVE